MKFRCPICDSDIKIGDSIKVGERVTCTSCSGQLELYKHRGKKVLACALCEEPVFDPGKCDECERRHELKKLYREGEL